MQTMTAGQVAAYLSKARMLPGRTVGRLGGYGRSDNMSVPRSPGVRTAADWSRFAYGSLVDDIFSFPGGRYWNNGQPYSENIIFNSTNGKGTPSEVAAAAAAAGASNATIQANAVVFPFTQGTGSAQPSTNVLPRNPNRRGLLIQNLSTTTALFVNFGSPASANAGLEIPINGGAVLFDVVCPINDVYVYFANAVAQPGICIEMTQVPQ